MTMCGRGVAALRLWGLAKPGLPCGQGEGGSTAIPPPMQQEHRAKCPQQELSEVLPLVCRSVHCTSGPPTAPVKLDLRGSRQAGQHTMPKQELPVTLDIVREKNLEQVKLLMSVIFPIKYAVRPSTSSRLGRTTGGLEASGRVQGGGSCGTPSTVAFVADFLNRRTTSSGSAWPAGR